MEGKFHVLTVTEDNVRMSQFIKRKHGPFDSKKAYYEYTQDRAEFDDLVCYRDVVTMKESKPSTRNRVGIILCYAVILILRNALIVASNISFLV